MKITHENMDKILVDAFDGPVGEAIRLFNELMDAKIITSMFSVDPFKEPTIMARNQGTRTGVYKLQEYVDSVKKSWADAEGNKVKNKKKKSDFPTHG